MSHRSVMETLDLHNDYGSYHSEVCASQVTFGWLSPRVSFSTEFIEFSPDATGRSRSGRLSPEKKKQMEDEAENSDSSPAEFEFSMASLNVAGNDTPGFIVPADELFHKGKLLPGYLPRHSMEKDDSVEFDTSCSLPEGPLGCSATAMSRQLNAEGISGPSLGCVLGPSCLRTPKGPKWRELFGALRRVKSDSGRQRVPDESLLPPKTFHGRKKFFKQIFGAGSGPQEDPKPTTGSTPHVGPSTSWSSHFSTAAGSSTVPSASHGKNSWDSSSSSTRLPSRASTGASAAAAVDFRNKASGVYPPPSTSTESSRPDFRGKSSSSQSSDGFTFNPTRGRARPSSSGTTSSNTNSGRVSPIKAPVRGANFGRSPSGRVIVRGLDRVASGGRNSASLQDQVRALRSREIRRSPDRSGYSNVRVTPVLNVPACMGPVLRGATKAGKGRLSNFRSFLTFKSKLPTTMSTAPIATR
ncbi:unnamed protein product [Calypogeia fissa]